MRDVSIFPSLIVAFAIVLLSLVVPRIIVSQVDEGHVYWELEVLLWMALTLAVLFVVGISIGIYLRVRHGGKGGAIVLIATAVGLLVGCSNCFTILE